jgi:hypothetical protein
MKNLRHESLDAALANLPVEIRPARDLWPAILQATHEPAAPVRGYRQRPLALAACLALGLLVGAVSWPLWHRTSGESVAARPAPVGDTPAIAVSYQLPQDADFLATRAALERTFAERLTLLAPKTRTRVQLDLEVIRKANADIRDALRADPASPLLLQLLRNTWQQEINLYTTVAHATDTLLTRRS